MDIENEAEIVPYKNEKLEIFKDFVLSNIFNTRINFNHNKYLLSELCDNDKILYVSLKKRYNIEDLRFSHPFEKDAVSRCRSDCEIIRFSVEKKYINAIEFLRG